MHGLPYTNDIILKQTTSYYDENMARVGVKSDTVFLLIDKPKSFTSLPSTALDIPKVGD